MLGVEMKKAERGAFASARIADGAQRRCRSPAGDTPATTVCGRRSDCHYHKLHHGS